jgi:hypothetical protein
MTGELHLYINNEHRQKWVNFLLATILANELSVYAVISKLFIYDMIILIDFPFI